MNINDEDKERQPIISPKKEKQNQNKSSNHLKGPQIQNFNDLLISCVKNDEYCYSMMDYFKKMINVRQIDYQQAYSELFSCFQPKSIINFAKYRKHLKGKWGRDDPGFLLLLIINLFFSSLVYSLSLSKVNIFNLFQLFFTQTCLILFTFGIVISAISKFIIDNYFKNDDIISNKTQSVEFMYAFDIHCNSFVPWYCFTVIIPFLILPITLGTAFIQTIIANSLLCVGGLFYFYVTFMSYFTLPFVRQNKYVTLGICMLSYYNLFLGPIILTFAIATLCNFNIFNYAIHVIFC